jgi:hypothetical protein
MRYRTFRATFEGSSHHRPCPAEEALLERVKAGKYQSLDVEKQTRHRTNFSFMKMAGLPEHESTLNLVDYMLILRSCTRRGGLFRHSQDAYFANR